MFNKSVTEMVEVLTDMFGVFGRIDLSSNSIYYDYINGRIFDSGAEGKDPEMVMKSCSTVVHGFLGLKAILKSFKDLSPEDKYASLEKINSSKKIAMYYDNNGLAYWTELFLNVDKYLSLSDEELIAAIKAIRFHDESELEQEELEEDDEEPEDEEDIIW